MAERFVAGLQALLETQRIVRSLHPALEASQPVAIAAGDQFWVYDIGLDGNYHRVLETPVPMPIPTGVRAAFNLDAYDNRIVCVVTPEIFDEAHGDVTLLHEFVHCYQANTCEMALKQNLMIARHAMQRGDFMWEINYPFPYAQPAFVAAYAALFTADDAGDVQAFSAARRQLSTSLNPEAFEYLHWQEWKEGFARWLENRMRRQLGLPENHNGRQPPYDRIALYEGGAAWIEHLNRQDVNLPKNIETLWYSRL